MKGVTRLLLCLLSVRVSPSCLEERPLLFCQGVPQAFSPGFSTLVMGLKSVGDLNSSVLQSDALSSITKLRFENAAITGISAGAFRSLQNLTALSLIQNQLTDISPSWFSRPGVLRELSLTGNRIRVLKGSTFEELTDLRRLGLNKNRITEIQPHTFSSLTNLAELDLSDNRLTQVSPQVFRSLRSTRIGLHGNPWDCSCEAEAFVDFLKDLQSRSLLNKSSEVTCGSPPPLRGRAVWNVSVCETTPRPPTGTQTVPPRPTAGEPKTSSPKPASETETSVNQTDGRTAASSLSVTPQTSGTKTSNPPGPSPPAPSVTSPTVRTATPVSHVTPPPSGTGISDRPKPSGPPRTDPGPTGATTSPETCETSRPPSDTNMAGPLIAVIAVLACLLFVACVLVVNRRKRSNKNVAPEKNRREEGGETSSRASRCLDPPETTRNHESDTEAGWRRSFTGVRAKSADAVLFTTPFGAPVTDQVTLQSETTEKPEDGAESEERPASDNQTKTNKRAVDGRKLEDGVSPNAETVPYLSIGTNRTENSPDKDGQTEGSVMEKVLSRVSTWPLMALQRQTRCKMTEEGEEEGEKASDVFAVRTPELLQEDFNKEKHPLDFGGAETEDGAGRNPPDESRHPQSSKFDPNTTFVTEEQQKKEDMIQDQNQTSALHQERKSQTRDRKAAKSSKKSRSKSKPRMEPQPAEREAHRSSRAPSGGASPDDETLLSGNEYAFMDLLHEVVQNNGRWTRERWRQTHGNTQRR